MTKKILTLLLIIYSTSSYSLQINHNGSTINSNDNNFTFAHSIWTNTKSDDNSFKGEQINYLLIDDIYHSGTLVLYSPYGDNSTNVKLYRLNKQSSSTYTTESIPVIESNGQIVLDYYYIIEPGEYLVEADFGAVIYPHITFDFFPDGNGECIHLEPSSSSSFNCHQSWLPAHYRKEVEPWIRGKIDLILWQMGEGVNQALAEARLRYFIMDSGIDVVNGINPSNRSKIIAKKIGQVFGASIENETFSALVDQSIQHALIADDVYRLFITGGTDGAAWISVGQQITADIVDISLSVRGILEIDQLEEEFNETRIAWEMLEAYIKINRGDWNGLVLYSGLDPSDNPNIYDIIDKIAESKGIENGWFNRKYDALKIEGLFEQGVYDFGDWVETRRTLINPFNDVDRDGIINQLDEYPNHPPVVEPPNQAPIAKITPIGTTYTLGDTITLNGNESFDPDNDPISQYSWTLFKPSGSNINLTTASGVTTSFKPNIEGSYTIRLRVSDGIDSDSQDIELKVQKIYTDPELVKLQPGRFAWIDIDLGQCNLYQLGTLTVPNGEIWKEVTFGVSRGVDVVLLADSDEPPDTKGTLGCPDYQQAFDTDEEWDLFVQGGFPDWTKTLFPGDQLYVAIFSYGGINSYQIIVDITIDLDQDGDRVPDDKDAFPNNSNKQYDSDSDGVDNKADKFNNDSAASIDSDDDGCPDQWNPGKTQADSTTRLVLDKFTNDPNECLDSDNDGIGDNADLFKNDPTEWEDSDGDSIGNNSDKFDNDPAASVDDDNDGHPDRWNPGKTEADSTTNLKLDQLPDNSNEWLDTDFDGVGDNSDTFPNDFTEWTDSDNDGVGDNADAAPNDSSRSANSAPVLQDIPTQILKPNQTVQINLIINDADDDNVTTELISSPTFVSLSNTVITISPNSDSIGEHNIIVKAYDDYGGTTLKAIQITVQPERLILTVTTTGSGNGTVTSAPPGINCGNDCSESYQSGTSVTLLANSDNNSKFDGWSGACFGTSNCVVEMDSNKQVTVNFSQIKFDLIIAKDGSGKVTSTPGGIDCGDDCLESYVQGTSVTLTVAADTDWEFFEWSGTCVGSGSCVVNMNSNKSVIATFKEKTPLPDKIFESGFD